MAATALASLALTACKKQDKDMGSAQKVGAQIDQKLGQSKKKIANTMDQNKQKLDNAMDKVTNKLDKANQKMNNKLGPKINDKLDKKLNKYNNDRSTSTTASANTTQ